MLRGKPGEELKLEPRQPSSRRTKWNVASGLGIQGHAAHKNLDHLTVSVDEFDCL